MRHEIALARVPVVVNGPPEMAGAIREVVEGEYESGYFGENLTILDLGGNVGSFSLWATMRWPGSRIHTYEPNPGSYAMLRSNVASRANVTCHNVAVFPSDKPTLPFWSRFAGDGEGGLVEYIQHTFQTLDTANVVEVPVLHPRDLPDADIIKVDVEGAEGPIVAHMDPARLERVSLFLMEYQDDQNLAMVKARLLPAFELAHEDRFPWDALIGRAGYTPELKGNHYGRAFFVNTRVRELGRLTFRAGAREVVAGSGARRLRASELLKMLPGIASDAIASRLRRLTGAGSAGA